MDRAVCRSFVSFVPEAGRKRKSEGREEREAVGLVWVNMFIGVLGGINTGILLIRLLRLVLRATSV